MAQTTDRTTDPPVLGSDPVAVPPPVDDPGSPEVGPPDELGAPAPSGDVVVVVPSSAVVVVVAPDTVVVVDAGAAVVVVAAGAVVVVADPGAVVVVAAACWAETVQAILAGLSVELVATTIWTPQNLSSWVAPAGPRVQAMPTLYVPAGMSPGLNTA